MTVMTTKTAKKRLAPGTVPAAPHWAILVHKTVDVATGNIDHDSDPMAVVIAFDERKDWEDAVQKLFTEGAKFSAIHVDAVATITATVNINVGI